MAPLTDMLKLHVNPRMKAANLRRRGSTYRLGEPLGSQGVIQIQRSGAMQPGEMAFFVNVGVLPLPWIEYVRYCLGLDPAPDPDFEHCVGSTRIIAPPRFRTDQQVHALQVRWSLPDMEQADQCSLALANILEHEVLPTLEDLLDPLQVYRLYQKPRAELGIFSRPLHSPSRNVLAAVMLAPYGPSSELDAAINELEGRGIDEPAKWAWLRAASGNPM